MPGAEKVTARTVFIIKPDAVQRGIVGTILKVAEEAGLVPVELRMGTLAPSVWQTFYAEHEGRPFFEELVEFMSSGPVVYGTFELPGGVHAILTWRNLIGATDPKKAYLGTLRRLYGTGDPANVAHGSDSNESMAREAAILGLDVTQR